MSAAFEISPSSLVAEAVFRLLKADPALQDYFSEIRRVEIEQILLGHYTAPALGLAIEASQESHQGTEIELQTFLQLAMITPVVDPDDGIEVWQRQDVIHHLRGVICSERGGALRDYRDPTRFVADALTNFERTPLLGPLQDGAYLLTPVRAVFFSRLARTTRELV